MALHGIKVIEMAGLAPAPFCGMILSDFGASVVRIDRPGGAAADVLARGKRSVCVDLKQPAGSRLLQRLCDNADVLVEPFRPGVMEKLGLGPERLCKSNPRLVYARLTGFGQSGPLSARAGHDINYLAISGVLSRLGWRGETPTPPVNLLADFAAGGLSCALGVVLALFERTKSGRGQVVDANMVEGASYLNSLLWNLRHSMFSAGRGQNVLDGGAYFYDVFKTSDGKFMSVGALEPQFYSLFIQGLGLDPANVPQDHTNEEFRRAVREAFASRTQAEWTAVFNDVDACVFPVLEMEEAAQHPHNTRSYVRNSDGDPEPRAAPTLSRTPANKQGLRRPVAGEHTTDVLRENGYSQADIEQLLRDRVVTSNIRSEL